ncbi:hypothetical protein WICPIJ_009732 [Wickerhamomyces pijperi]|uniref:Uncharacterized protein n=1 Tax=Wickerhamomyces pijperi TaxID=599730 RepID=A0A9P8TCE3_WICPI|nr:hypothetical protein WICPIJ_009732 [Wickerhamomyces pijperi]
MPGSWSEMAKISTLNHHQLPDFHRISLILLATKTDQPAKFDFSNFRNLSDLSVLGEIYGSNSPIATLIRSRFALLEIVVSSTFVGGKILGTCPKVDFLKLCTFTNYPVCKIWL